MANNTRQDGSVTVTAAEVIALRGIVNDWLGEEIALPPYSKELAALLQKLGVDVADAAGNADHKRSNAAEDAGGPADADTALGPQQLRRNLG